ncbi:CvpA family protein [bacterium]|nr:CvpA family protein [bacterium]
MNWVDWILLAISAASVFAGLMRGAIRTVFSVVGIVVAFVVASRESGAVGMVLAHRLPEPAAAAAGFLAVFLGIAFVFTLLGWLLRKLLQGLALTWLDRTAGAALGLLRAAVIVGVLALATEGLGGLEDTKKAVTWPVALGAGRLLLGFVPEETLDRLDWDRLREWIPDGDDLKEKLEGAI